MYGTLRCHRHDAGATRNVLRITGRADADWATQSGANLGRVEGSAKPGLLSAAATGQ